MISTVQLLQVLIINQPLLPQIAKKVKLGSTRPGQGMAKQLMISDMLQSQLPRIPPVVRRALEFRAERTLDCARGFLAAEMGEAMGGPFFLVIGDVRARKKPKGAFEGRQPGLGSWALEYAVDFFEEGDAFEAASKTGTNRRFGRSCFGEEERGWVV